jgi:hypothetical protein
MKLLRIASLTWFLLASLRNVSGQGFVDVNFESVSGTPVPLNYGVGIATTNGIPGWTATGGDFNPTYILYDTFTLGDSAISLFDTNNGFAMPVLAGRYSLWLFGGGSSPQGVSISQTATVPANAHSIQFMAEFSPGILMVSLGGHNLPFSALSSTSDYTLFGGDVTAFAGESETLTFTVPRGINNTVVLDDITFSASQVPEPRTLSLFGGCTLLLCWHLRRQNLA